MDSRGEDSLLPCSEGEAANAGASTRDQGYFVFEPQALLQILTETSKFDWISKIFVIIPQHNLRVNRP